MKGMKLYSFWQVNNRRIRRYLFLWKQFSSSWFQFQSHNWTRMESEMDSESYQQLQQKQLIQFHNPNQKKGKKWNEKNCGWNLALRTKRGGRRKEVFTHKFLRKECCSTKEQEKLREKSREKGQLFEVSWHAMMLEIFSPTFGHKKTSLDRIAFFKVEERLKEGEEMKRRKKWWGGEKWRSGKLLRKKLLREN